MKIHKIRIAKSGKNAPYESDKDFDKVVYFEDEQSAVDYYNSVNLDNYFVDRCELINGEWESRAFSYSPAFDEN